MKEVINEDEIVVYEIDNKSGTKNGTFKRLRNDVLVEECFYQNNLLEGERILYDSEGNKIVSETYMQGQFHGPYRTYYPIGTVKLEGEYQNGTMEGEWISYYEDGQMKESVMMKANNENGPFVEYHPNGRLKAKGEYKDGDHEHGELLLYDEEGQLFKKMMCDNGFCNTTWQKDSL